MKRISIWLRSFTLLQQFLAIVFLTFAILIFFVFGYLNNNVDQFVNAQMYTYLHRSQSTYISSRDDIVESSVVHLVYNKESERFLNNIPADYEEMISGIDFNSIVSTTDGYYDAASETIVYSITPFEDNYLLLSVVKSDFRTEVKAALFNGVVNVTMYVVIGVIVMIMVWVMSLIRPINQMTGYVNNIKLNQKATLEIDRKDEIGQLAESLSTMHEELTRQQSIRDEMVQNISHDLKTPIATIKSYSEAIKDHIYPYDTLEKSVDVISENADRLQRKVYSLITYNKMDYIVDKDPGVLNLEMAPLINKVILNVQVLRNDISIETDLNEKVMFHGDEEPWRVVVENLLDNALRYAETTVRITLKDNLLEVYNDGPLIEENRLDKLFKPYEMGNKGKFGLGLSIVKKVTEVYGYSVTGENMNDGVVFRIFTLNKMKKARKTRKETNNA
ncbi:MAG: HAMP domain-containing sensor histidine kinase [Erysipelotrichaceae bacterium]|nr:HAMP domain-containing sensor histidine kinase [Erysipelotrichaceae bacterium]